MLKALWSVFEVVLVFKSAFIHDKTPLSAGSFAASRRVDIKGAHTDVDRMWRFGLVEKFSLKREVMIFLLVGWAVDIMINSGCGLLQVMMKEIVNIMWRVLTRVFS
jgi:hypothetical protein